MATITTLSATQGKPGDSITINGSGMSTTARVNFGSTPVTPTTVTATTVIFTVPNSAPCSGQVSVSVTSTSGITSNSLAFFRTAIPTTTGTSVTCVPAATGGSVTLFGSGFAAGGTITVGSVGTVALAAGGNDSQTTFTAPANATQATCIVPQTITVTTAGGTSTSGTTLVEYTNPPVLAAATATPATGPDGTTVTVSGGSCLDGITSATFTDSGATVFTPIVSPIDGTSFTFDVPATAATGAATLTVTTCGGTSGTLAFTVT
ncbi:IPT/TIG domain-containing protein [Streptomyces sp. 4503]|uniref:IPT/TIG domain-containing protein n=1 Tax=Streptomyces niphimycinicus TaxID=2842201 RepID=A0ABS6CH14_9ACTN|nr:IPT/TIG domain-containing protein [Streptomyces niphimycinicus]